MNKVAAKAEFEVGRRELVAALRRLRNGLTKAEISEALLQVAVYCGVPAGIDSTRIAREAIAEYEAENAAT